MDFREVGWQGQKFWPKLDDREELVLKFFQRGIQQYITEVKFNDWCIHRLENYAAATESKGSPVTGLVGWVDGTYIQGMSNIWPTALLSVS